MSERFTERARMVVVLAQEEARNELKHNDIGSEHILLGLLRDQEGLAARVLESFGVSVEAVRDQIVRIIGSGEEVTSGQIPFTPRAKKILEISRREALSLSHNQIAPEHILLGLVRENEGVAMRILLDFDLDAQEIRNAVIRLLPGSAGAQHARSSVGARAVDFKLVVRPDRELRRLLMAAGGRALSDERQEFGLADLLAAVKETQETFANSAACV